MDNNKIVKLKLKYKIMHIQKNLKKINNLKTDENRKMLFRQKRRK